MARNAILLFLVSAVWACGEAPADRVAQAGLASSLIPDRPWRWELPPPDTLDTVTRRVWYGGEVDPTGTPSPDGRFYTHPDMATGALAIRDLATGQTRLLTAYEAPYYPGFSLLPRFSPDGRHVAFTWWRSEAPEKFGLRVMDVQGGEARALGEPSSWIHAEGWTPDGRYLLANRGTEEGVDAVRVSVEDGSTRVLRHFAGEGPGRMALSPDGRFVLVDLPASPDDPYSRDLFALPVEGGPEIPVVRHPANEFVLGWAPEGDYILFGSDRTGTPGAWLQRVREGAPQGDPLLVKPDLWGVWGLGFTEDGRFFYSVGTGAREIHVVTLDPEAGRVVGSPEVLSPHTLGSQVRPSWSPDGRYLAYLVEQFRGSSTSNPPTLAIRAMDTGQERLLRLPADVYLPREHQWLADGQSLLLRYMDRDMAAGIRRIDLRTGESQVVYFRPEGNVHNFMITPDGKTLLVYLREERPDEDQLGTALVARDLESGEEREIFRAPVEDGRLTGFSSLSPDGTTVAAWHGPGTEAWARLFTIPLDGGEPREIPTAEGVRLGYQVMWTPDQRFLITTRPDDPDDASNPTRHLVRVDIETGETQDLGLSGGSIQSLRLSPDGRQLAYVAGSESYEVWVMEGFLPGRDRD
jgi:Tol biopolymer transport system component